MRYLFRKAWCNLPTEGQYATFNCLLISVWYFSTTYDDIAHEERRIWAICSWVLGLHALERRVHPCWLHNVYHEIESAVVVWEVGRL